jgi:hypothetical protein
VCVTACVLSLLYLLRQIGSIRLHSHLYYIVLSKTRDDWPTHKQSPAEPYYVELMYIAKTKLKRRYACVHT